MRRRALLPVGAVIGVLLLVGIILSGAGMSEPNADCGLGMGDVTALVETNTTVTSPSNARRELIASVNDSEGSRVSDELRANVSAYEHVDLVDTFREDIEARADGNTLNDSESVYYFTVNGSRSGYSTIGITESGVVFEAHYGSC